MSSPQATPAFWSYGGSEKQARLAPYVLDSEALKRLYSVLQDASSQAAQSEAAQLADQRSRAKAPDQPDPTPEELEIQKYQLTRLYEVAITVKGVNGEQTLTTDPSVLEEPRLPYPLKSIEMEVGLLYRGLLQGRTAQNRAVVHFDFTTPRVLDLSNPSGAPTPNNSAVLVSGSNTTWVSGVYDRILDALCPCRARIGWLHSSHVYDVLLVFIGLFACLGAAVAASDALLFRTGVDPLSPIRTAGFFYVFVVTLLLFRLSFSLLRALLPYMEFPRPRQTLRRKARAGIASFLFAILTSLTAAAIWQLVVT